MGPVKRGVALVVYGRLASRLLNSARSMRVMALFVGQASQGFLLCNYGRIGLLGVLGFSAVDSGEWSCIALDI